VTELVSGSGVQHVAACLTRIDSDRHGAIVHRRDQAALGEAAGLDGRDTKSRASLPLAGICFTAKAALGTGEMPSTAGSLLLDEAVMPAAPAVGRLREAGAILVGVTNCAEFALAPVDHTRRYGRTLNPRNTGLTPGGSSSGCAAAVAAGIVSLSVGTDYGGSVRYPAHCTGVLGLRPPRRLVPVSGQVPAPPV
jgi:amidase